MTAVLQEATTVCGVLVAVEFLGNLCEETELLRFVRGVALLLLLTSFLVSLSRTDFTLSLPQSEAAATGEQLTSVVESAVEESVQQEFTDTLQGLLATIGLQAEKITVSTTKTDDGSIVLDKAELWFAYQADSERAKALLCSVIGQEVEVICNAAP